MDYAKSTMLKKLLIILCLQRLHKIIPMIWQPETFSIMQIRMGRELEIELPKITFLDQLVKI